MARTFPWNIPNTISLIRILLVPLFLYLLFREAYAASLFICLTAGISDVADGYLARRFHSVTKTGAMLDPIADKLLVIGSVLVLTHMELLPIWIASVIFIRDILIVAGAGYVFLNTENPSLRPCFMGKVNTFLQFSLIFMVLLKQKEMLVEPMIIPVSCVATAITTIVSGGMYLSGWLRQLRREKNPPLADKPRNLAEYG